MERIGTDVPGETSIHCVVCLPQPQDSVSIVHHSPRIEGSAHLCKVLPAGLAGEEVFDETRDDEERVFTPESHLGAERSCVCLSISSVCGEGEECEGVCEGPEGAGVAAIVGLTATTVVPLGTPREDGVIQL